MKSLDLLLRRSYFRRWVKDPQGYVAGSIPVRDLVNVVLFADACRAAILNQSQPVAETDTTSQQFESLAGKAVGGSEGFECTPVADLYELLTKCGECYDYTTSDKVAADWIKEGYSAREYVKLDRLQEALIFAAPEQCK